MSAPNHIWTADFKGQFKTLDGRYCYPLTVVDGYSRFLLGCQALEAPQSKLTRPVFHRLFREYGLPQIIRTDNGAPFATATALARLSPGCRSGGSDWASFPNSFKGTLISPCVRIVVA